MIRFQHLLKNGQGAAVKLLGQFKPAFEAWWASMTAPELSESTKSLLTEIGRAQIEQSNADLAAATAGADAIAHAARAYAEYRAQPWLGSDGQPVQVPVIDAGDLQPSPISRSASW